MKTYALVLLIMGILVTGLLVLIGKGRMDDFSVYHNSIAQESTLSVTESVERFVSEKKRLVQLFAQDHYQLLSALANQPDNEVVFEQLQIRVEEYFPKFFSFNIANTEGDLFIDDFDGKIGELCKRDLQAFSQSNVQLPRIHPNYIGYHFDVLAPFGEHEGILFISFHADVLGDILKSSQTLGHQLMLVHADSSHLIEVTAIGPRNNLDRDDYRLNDDEKQRILYSAAVPGTGWHAIDLHETDLFSQFTHKILLQSIVILLLYSVVAVFMFVYIKRETLLRHSAERHKDEFLSVVSHELRTPLTAIQGALGLVYNGVAGDLHGRLKELISIALSNSERLTLLINDFLDVQKIEAGKMNFDKKPTDLVQLVNDSLINYQSYADQFNVKYQSKTPEIKAVVTIDKGRIEQVMANLLSNAAKYGATSDTVDVDVQVNANKVRVNVTDHGAGIPESFRSRIFDKFAQGDASNTRKVSGTGLGLSIVKLIVEEHDGKVGFESEVDQGSTFYFELPLYNEVTLI